MKSLLSTAARLGGLTCALMACTPVKTAPPDPMQGLWVNNTEGNLFGIHLQTDGNCELFVERFMQPRTERGCRFELLEETDRWLVFLKDKNGLCGNEANYEFNFDAQTPALRFHAGGNTVVMYKDEPAL